MTSLIDNNIDELIRRVRLRTAVSDMVFITAYPPRELPNLIAKYTVAVENKGVRQSEVFIGNDVGSGVKGCLYEIGLNLRTYAPRHTSASALLRMTSQLFDALQACDTEDALTQISLGAVDYDSTARTYYRDLHAELGWLLCEEGRDE